jgi:hypothetical protein
MRIVQLAMFDYKRTNPISTSNTDILMRGSVEKNIWMSCPALMAKGQHQKQNNWT